MNVSDSANKFAKLVQQASILLSDFMTTYHGTREGMSCNWSDFSMSMGVTVRTAIPRDCIHIEMVIPEEIMAKISHRKHSAMGFLRYEDGLWVYDIEEKDDLDIFILILKAVFASASGVDERAHGLDSMNELYCAMTQPIGVIRSSSNAVWSADGSTVSAMFDGSLCVPMDAAKTIDDAMLGTMAGNGGDQILPARWNKRLRQEDGSDEELRDQSWSSKMSRGTC